MAKEKGVVIEPDEVVAAVLPPESEGPEPGAVDVTRGDWDGRLPPGVNFGPGHRVPVGFTIYDDQEFGPVEDRDIRERDWRQEDFSVVLRGATIRIRDTNDPGKLAQDYSPGWYIQNGDGRIVLEIAGTATPPGAGVERPEPVPNTKNPERRPSVIEVMEQPYLRHPGSPSHWLQEAYREGLTIDGVLILRDRQRHN